MRQTFYVGRNFLRCRDAWIKAKQEYLKNELNGLFQLYQTHIKTV